MLFLNYVELLFSKFLLIKKFVYVYWKQVEIFLLHRQIFSLVLRKLVFWGLYFTQKSQRALRCTHPSLPASCSKGCNSLFVSAVTTSNLFMFPDN